MVILDRIDRSISRHLSQLHHESDPVPMTNVDHCSCIRNRQLSVAELDVEWLKPTQVVCLFEPAPANLYWLVLGGQHDNTFLTLN